MFNLKVNNFRSFLNQEFKFSRINILIGENSGGKSSLLKLLLALKQTLDNPSESNLKLSGDYVDLGNFQEVIYYKKKSKKITIEFDFKAEYNDFFIKEWLDVISRASNQIISNLKLIQTYRNFSNQIRFEFDSRLDEHTSIKTTIKNTKIGKLEFIIKPATDGLSTKEVYADLKFTFKKQSVLIENCTAYKEGFLTIIDQDLKKKCIDNFGESDGRTIYFQLAYLLVTQNYIKKEFEKIEFVNPIGSSPKRFYFKEDKKNSYKLIDIEKLINILSNSSHSKNNYNNALSLLNKTIKEFGIAEEVEIAAEKNIPVLALNVKTKDYWSNITDVGYGVSLQLPILFQAILSENYSENGETLLIEQPEVHLHPNLQAKFIETLIGLGSKNSYFIETHSEHIIRKLQVLIKNKTFGLNPEDVTIHYFKRDSLQFAITSHSINDYGKLTPNLPSGFYDTSYNLVKELI
ncbi:DUF3696 domain-containing protein [Mucilaginibacter sp. 14171R-50]|uniref:DUF3696 domain-containing protein n=1 Tax=Mucilaginibacter sp. 14171R-50 TaxID=2703789 RepID=UPI00138CD5E3|nr:DUF3696 domain-containing protein [Mucilaginibacter sp. 14171R-50]QHS56359.1 DUF3696 domain-containing protein [Mucilaginibacter sp. 14171R-50]